MREGIDGAHSTEVVLEGGYMVSRSKASHWSCQGEARAAERVRACCILGTVRLPFQAELPSELAATVVVVRSLVVPGRRAIAQSFVDARRLMTDGRSILAFAVREGGMEREEPE